MAKIPNKPTPQNNIPVQESKHKGIPVTDVKSAQEALMAQLQAPASEEPVEQEVQTEVEENTSEQAMENAESVETKTEDSGELTVDDLVDDNQEEVNQEPISYTVKVDGKDVEVTLDELQAGYSRQADYTRKSQVLAEQRKKADDELAATQQERQRYSEQLEQINQLANSKLKQFDNVDWEKLKLEDPMQYAIQRESYRDLKDEQKTIEKEKDDLKKKEQEELQQKIKGVLEENKKILAEKLPILSDPAKGKEVGNKIKNFALSLGFSDQEVNSIIDARIVQVLYDAMQYNNLKKAKISKKMQRVVPKVTTPGSGTTKGEVSSDRVKQLRARAKRSGKVDDAAALINSLMPKS
jgi:hypothetical protein